MNDVIVTRSSKYLERKSSVYGVHDIVTHKSKSEKRPQVETTEKERYERFWGVLRRGYL